MVGRQAVLESFFIVETLAVWTQEVELSWVKNIGKSLINRT